MLKNSKLHYNSQAGQVKIHNNVCTGDARYPCLYHVHLASKCNGVDRLVVIFHHTLHILFFWATLCPHVKSVKTARSGQDEDDYGVIAFLEQGCPMLHYLQLEHLMPQRLRHLPLLL